MRLTGFAAVEYAEKHNRQLTKRRDATDEAEVGLTVAEAAAIAEEDEELIYLEIPEDEYRRAAPTSFEPERMPPLPPQ